MAALLLGSGASPDGVPHEFSRAFSGGAFAAHAADGNALDARLQSATLDDTFFGTNDGSRSLRAIVHDEMHARCCVRGREEQCEEPCTPHHTPGSHAAKLRGPARDWLADFGTGAFEITDLECVEVDDERDRDDMQYGERFRGRRRLASRSMGMNHATIDVAPLDPCPWIRRARRPFGRAGGTDGAAADHHDAQHARYLEPRMTPLLAAVTGKSHRHCHIVNLLQAAGADLNRFCNLQGHTPLTFALTMTVNPAMVECLLRNGALPHRSLSVPPVYAAHAVHMCGADQAELVNRVLSEPSAMALATRAGRRLDRLRLCEVIFGHWERRLGLLLGAADRVLTESRKPVQTMIGGGMGIQAWAHSVPPASTERAYMATRAGSSSSSSLLLAILKSISEFEIDLGHWHRLDARFADYFQGEHDDALVAEGIIAKEMLNGPPGPERDYAPRRTAAQSTRDCFFVLNYFCRHVGRQSCVSHVVSVSL